MFSFFCLLISSCLRKVARESRASGAPRNPPSEGEAVDVVERSAISARAMIDLGDSAGAFIEFFPDELPKDMMKKFSF
jgi:hypothetical protein